MSEQEKPKRPGQYDRTQRNPHPQTGKWDVVPVGVWMDANEVAEFVGCSSKRVTNRFQQGKCPEGWRVERKKACNWYMRVRPETVSD